MMIPYTNAQFGIGWISAECEPRLVPALEGLDCTSQPLSVVGASGSILLPAQAIWVALMYSISSEISAVTI